MNPETRNNLLIDVFDYITNEEYYLGFKYDPTVQQGSCTCSNSGFIRFPMFVVKHNKNKSIIYFTSHHRATTRVSVDADENFYNNAIINIKEKLIHNAGDWNDVDNPFHPEYGKDDKIYDAGYVSVSLPNGLNAVTVNEDIILDVNDEISVSGKTYTIIEIWNSNHPNYAIKTLPAFVVSGQTDIDWVLKK